MNAYNGDIVLHKRMTHNTPEINTHNPARLSQSEMILLDNDFLNE